jgi:GBP family porin
MKKLLIATAALAMVAGTAQAQSSVTVYGAYGNGITSTEIGGVKYAAQSQNDARDHLGTTALGFKGTEDLGGGLSAFFMLEGDLSGNGVLGANPTYAATKYGTTTNIFNRHAHAGFTSKQLGTLSVGRQNDSIKDTEGLAQVYNLSDNLMNKTRIGDRIANATKYTTPTFNGLSASYTYSNNPADSADITSPTYDATKDNANSGDGANTHNSFAINYKLPVNGGVDLAYASGEETTTGGVQAGKTTRISARTVVMGVTLGAAYTTNQAAATAEKTKQTLASANYTMGKIDLKAHYVKNDATANTGNTTDGFDGDGYGAMVVYNLSKRTAAYAGYSDFSGTSAANDTKVTTFGFLHKF